MIYEVPFLTTTSTEDEPAWNFRTKCLTATPLLETFEMMFYLLRKTRTTVSALVKWTMEKPTVVNDILMGCEDPHHTQSFLLVTPS
jgi:hypothetical protein